jgi:hypothetical protein
LPPTRIQEVGVADAELERILDPSYLDDLERWSTAEVRTRRAACEAAEEGVSYARRLVQGRLDILRAELLRRDDAGDGVANDLLSGLPAILSGDAVPTDPLRARATRVRVPASAAAYEAELDALVHGSEFERLEDRSTEDLAALIGRLADHERTLSSRRRELFGRIDALRDELADRYKDGRADIGQILADT